MISVTKFKPRKIYVSDEPAFDDFAYIDSLIYQKYLLLISTDKYKDITEKDGYLLEPSRVVHITTACSTSDQNNIVPSDIAKISLAVSAFCKGGIDESHTGRAVHFGNGVFETLWNSNGAKQVMNTIATIRDTINELDEKSGPAVTMRMDPLALGDIVTIKENGQEHSTTKEYRLLRKLVKPEEVGLTKEDANEIRNAVEQYLYEENGGARLSDTQKKNVRSCVERIAEKVK